MLLGLNLESIPQTRPSLWYLLTADRLQYADLWRQREIPTMRNWKQSVIQIFEMDKLTRKLREQDSEQFEKC